MRTSLLLQMLEDMRPHGSETVKTYSEAIRVEIESLGWNTHVDEIGNIIAARYPISLNNPANLPTNMFTSHVDTVHSKEGRQEIEVDGDGWVSLPRGSTSNCLGADDATGNFIMLEMIRHNVEGVYIFHQGEERGGIGSSFLIKEYPDFISHFDVAIALDRKGYGDIVTHQMGQRCASDKAAAYLRECLTSDSVSMVEDDTGIFTDTAIYSDIIPECFNLSVGYFSEHTRGELLDLNFVEELIPLLVAIDYSDIPVVRNPYEIEYDEYAQFPLQPRDITEEEAWDLVMNYPGEAVDIIMSYYSGE